MTYAPLSLDGRVAVVVGGTSGIGRALSLGLADAGADVVATGRRADAVASIALDLEQRGRRTLRVPTDVTDRASVERLRDQVLAAYGRVADILVNCAGRTKRNPTLDLAEDEWRQILETNLNGSRSARARCSSCRPMIAQRYGRIVNIASLASFVAFHEVARVCAASKAAVAALTKSLAVEWAEHGACINAIAPRDLFRTALNPGAPARRQRSRTRAPRAPDPGGASGEVEEIAEACIFLASRGGRRLRQRPRARRRWRLSGQRRQPIDARTLAMIDLAIKPAAECQFDAVSLGEVMLRLDPGDGRIHTSRTFQAWEGGGEYNVARGLRRCFGLRTAIVTALADNAIGRLVEDLMLQGGVDVSHVRWVPYDGVGRAVRNGLTHRAGLPASAARSDARTEAIRLPCRWSPRTWTGRRSSEARGRALASHGGSSPRFRRVLRASRKRRWRKRAGAARASRTISTTASRYGALWAGAIARAT